MSVPTSVNSVSLRFQHDLPRPSVTRCTGREAVSELFCYRVEFVTPVAANMPFEKVVGQEASLDVLLADGSNYSLDGIIRLFEQTGRDSEFQYFAAEFVPEVWRLTKNRRSRIFQNKTTPEILAAVFEGRPFSLRLTEKYWRHNYCVQYRESDFAFASRLMEEEGIHYYFERSERGQALVLTDKSDQCPPLPGGAVCHYRPIRGENDNSCRIRGWRKRQEVRAIRYANADYAFQLADNKVRSSSTAPTSLQVGSARHSFHADAHNAIGIEDYPALIAHRFDGVDGNGQEQAGSLQDVFAACERAARVRMDQETAHAVRIEGEADPGLMIPGRRFALADHFDGDGEYFVLAVERDLKFPLPRSQAEPAVLSLDRFVCLPLALPFLPPGLTPVPTVKGSQSAFVVGPPGQDVFTDKYGRVKVRFPWDAGGGADNSCWVRVSQGWAGKNYGMAFVPRIGQEVIVDFLDGDPDAPIITGSVYNSVQSPPFDFPADATRLGIKTQTSGGSPSQFSGLAFEDHPGSQYVQLYSERDLIMNAENDHSLYVAGNQQQQIGGLSLRTVGSLFGGSHSGGGGSGAGGASGSEAVEWSQPSAGASIGLDYNLVVGEELRACVGYSADNVIGTYNQTIINPFGFVKEWSEQAPTIAAGVSVLVAMATGIVATCTDDDELLKIAAWGGLLGAGLSGGGSQKTIFGSDTELQFGHRLHAQHGTNITYHTNVRAPNNTIGVNNLINSLAASVALTNIASSFAPLIVSSDQDALCLDFGLAGLNTMLTDFLALAEQRHCVMKVYKLKLEQQIKLIDASIKLAADVFREEDANWYELDGELVDLNNLAAMHPDEVESEIPDLMVNEKYDEHYGLSVPSDFYTNEGNTTINALNYSLMAVDNISIMSGTKNYPSLLLLTKYSGALAAEKVALDSARAHVHGKDAVKLSSHKNVTLEINESKNIKLTDKEIELCFGSAKISMKSNELSIGFESSTITLNDDGISLKNGNSTVELLSSQLNLTSTQVNAAADGKAAFQAASIAHSE